MNAREPPIGPKRLTAQATRALNAAAGLLFLAGTVSAQMLVVDRYPWDQRPSSCFEEGATDKPECRLDSWPTWEVTVLRIQNLYKLGHFRQLERALGEVSKSPRRFESGDSPAAAAYWAFRLMFKAPGMNPAQFEQISRWRAAVPDSSFVDFAEARFHYAMAWNARGTSAGAKVTRESWTLFNERLRKAESILKGISGPLKESPISDHLLMSVSLDSSAVETDPRQAFIRGVQKWPDYYEFYEVMLTRLVPRWGGSWEAVEGFIRYWSEALSEHEGDSIYARFYISMKSRGYIRGETRMDWEMMKHSLVELIARYPHPDYPNLYASFACKQRDKEAFIDALNYLQKDDVLPKVWHSGYSYDTCLLWARV